MEYKGITILHEFYNGSWITTYTKLGNFLKRVEWKGNVSDDDIRNVIDKEILPFI